MMTAEHVATVHEPLVGRAPRTRITPTRLRAVSLGLAVLVVATGVVTALAAAERHAATAAGWQKSEPLVVGAQAIDSYLSDADTTAAGSFLRSQIEPAGLRVRYTSDLARASANLAQGAQEAGPDPAVTSSIRTVSVDVPVYAGLVQTATFNEREAFYPLAAAYIGEANNLMQQSILPAATQLYSVENQRLAADLGTAGGAWLVVLAAVLFLALLVLLSIVQVSMSRHFRRTFNLYLVGATAVTLVLGIWFTVAIATQSSGVNAATSGGSGPLVVFTQARIDALRMTADDELTLLTRDSEPGLQPDYRATVSRLDRLLGSAGNGAGAVEQDEVGQARRALAAYRRVHAQIRRLDTTGTATGEQDADSLAASQLPAASSTLDGDLAHSIAASQRAFDQSMSGATSDTAGLIWASVILSVLGAVLVLVGFRARIAEYR